MEDSGEVVGHTRFRQAHGFCQFGKERLGISETRLAISSSAEDTEVKAMRSLWMSET